MSVFDLKLGYLCNNNCIHCVVADQRLNVKNYFNKEANRSFDYITKLLLTQKSKGVNSIVLTGGEPTIRKDFFDILKLCYNNFYINLQTNGRAFYYDWFVKNFSEIIIKKDSINMVIALHGPNEKIHDSITRTKGSFKQTTKGLLNLVESGFSNSVVIKVVLSKFNVNYIKDIFSYVSSLGLNKIALAHPHGVGNAGKFFYDVVPKYSNYRDNLNLALSYAEKNGLTIHLETIPFCFLNPEFRKLKNDYLNYEAFLFQLDMPKPENWAVARKNIRRKSKLCNSCIYDNICEGVWSDYAEGYGLDELIPIKNTKD